MRTNYKTSKHNWYKLGLNLCRQFQLHDSSHHFFDPLIRFLNIDRREGAQTVGLRGTKHKASSNFCHHSQPPIPRWKAVELDLWTFDMFHISTEHPSFLLKHRATIGNLEPRRAKHREKRVRVVIFTFLII